VTHEATGAAIEVSDLVHRYGRTLAVDHLSLQIPAGEVYGLLGHNGAGKSTTIRCLLGLQRPTSGRTRVLSLDSWKEGVAIRRRCGYVPEDPQFYPWMTVAETLRFAGAFHPTWDAAHVERMTRALELPPQARMRELSRGMSAKVALACATGFHPEALLLDDPTSGLDAVVRREFLEQVIALAAEGGRAVLFSSHVLDEVERIADRVGIVVGGRMILERRVDDLKASFRRVVLTFDGAPPELRLDGLVSSTVEGRALTLVVDGWTPAHEAVARAARAVQVDAAGMPLEDIFVDVVRAAKRAGAAA
jgi:ABC-2 type transport system ATP-binding protein